MRSRSAPCRVSFFLLLTGLLLQAPIAAGQEPPFPLQTHLTADERSRLAEASRDSALAPWQREFMLGVARNGVDGTATQPSPALPSVSLRSDGIAADDGTWIAIPPPAERQGHTAIYDPVRDRMVVFGGSEGGVLYNDVWALSLAGSSAWSEITPSGTLPSGSAGHTAIYDPLRDRMVVFGGSYYDGTYHYRNDVWALSLGGSPAWSELAPAGTLPSPRSGHTAIYDPLRDRMVVFGGDDGSLRNDVWALSLAASVTWSELAAAGTLPSPRSEHTAIYDPVRDRMVVSAGWDGSGPYRNDVWALSLAGSPAWSGLTPPGGPPYGREGHTAIYDPLHDRMVVFGGVDGSPYRNDVWGLSLAGSPAWSEVTPAGTLPTDRGGHAAIYDPVRDRMVVFGGLGNYNWDDGSYHLLNDVWALSLSGSPAWSELTSPATVPSERYGHSAIYDPLRDRMVVFGGRDVVNFFDDVWELSLSGSPTWSEITPSGLLPSPHYFHSAIYDPLRDRMVVFGGGGNDVWALSLSGNPAWTELTPSGPPPHGRYGHTAIYDPLRDRMVVFGGDDGGNVYGDVWALSLSGSPAWSELAPAGTTPPGLAFHTAIYDPVRDRMVVFVGYGGGLSNDLWVLSLSGIPTWSELTISDAPHPWRYKHTAIYDPVRDRMVVFGGYEWWLDSMLNDAWALSFSGIPAWNALAPRTPQGARDGHTAIYDPVRDRMIVFGGRGPNWDGVRNDSWALTWGTPISTVAMAFDLTPNTLNLASHGLWVTGFLEPASPFTASAIDVASIRLNSTVPVDPAAPTALGDHDGNGIPDLMVKFNRAAVELTLSEGDRVPVHVTGTVDGHSFSGTDYIRARRAVVSAPAAGSHLTVGSVTPVLWQTPSGVTVESVALLVSPDGGNTWSLVARGQPNTGSYDWTVPNVQTDQAKVAVVLVESADSTGDVVDGVLGVSETFSIEGTVGVGDQGPAQVVLALRGATPNPAAGGRPWVEFSLRDGSPAKLELVDVTGRVLSTRQVGLLGPGTHALDLSEGGALPPGIYFLRLTQGASEVRGRIAILR
jgi:hypothetical protein